MAEGRVLFIGSHVLLSTFAVRRETLCCTQSREGSQSKGLRFDRVGLQGRRCRKWIQYSFIEIMTRDNTLEVKPPFFQKGW